MKTRISASSAPEDKKRLFCSLRSSVQGYRACDTNGAACFAVRHMLPLPSAPSPSLFSLLTFTMSPGHRCTFGHQVDPPEQPALIILLEGVVGRGGLSPRVCAAGGTQAQVAAAAADAAPPGRLMEDLLVPPFVPLHSLSSLTSFSRTSKVFPVVCRLIRRFSSMIFALECMC